MAYENVTAPQLPEYDSTTFPYYLLQFNFDEGATDWVSVFIIYAESPFVYDSDSKFINGSVATFGWQRSYYDAESWDDLNGSGLQEWGLELNLFPGMGETVFHRIYTNHDILDSNGNVYLAADSVTPVEEEKKNFDLRSWLIGYTLGICGKPLPLSTARTARSTLPHPNLSQSMNKGVNTYA